MGNRYKKIALLENKRAGSSGFLRESKIFRLLDELVDTKVQIIDEPDVHSAVRVLEKSIGDGTDLVIGDGGDGTKHWLSKVAANKCVVGYITGGTGNDFASALGLSGGSLEDQLRVALESDPVAIDLIKSKFGYANTIAYLGIGEEINDLVDRFIFARLFGSFVYKLVTVYKVLSPSYRAKDVEIKVGDATYSGKAVLIAVANTRSFGGGLDICPTADPTDGELTVCIVGDATRREILSMLPKLPAHVDHPKVNWMKGPIVEIVTEGLKIRADGEIYGVSPVTFEADRGALLVAGAAPVLERTLSIS
jgi:diacylglycerol kinase (ATP)